MLPTDEDLVVASIDGDNDAFAELVRRYTKSIYAFTYRLTGNIEVATDATQETFVKVWRNLKKFRVGGSFKTWVFVIARTTTIDIQRKRTDVPFAAFENEEGENALESSLSDSELLPDALAERAEEKRVLDDVVTRLPPASREVLTLHFEQGLTFDEIGKIVGEPLDTVKSRHRRALIALRKLLETKLGPGTYK